MGFKSVGENVQFAMNCTVIGIENISIGNNVRIDGFSTISAHNGFLTLGDYIHIGGYCFLAAGAGIVMEDFSGLSQGVKIYSKSDDYSGEFLTNPTVPSEYTNVKKGTVTLLKHVIIGSGSVILPNVLIREGSAVGALSLVTRSIPAYKIYAGSPAKEIADRKTNLIDLEISLRQQYK